MSTAKQKPREFWIDEGSNGFDLDWVRRWAAEFPKIDSINGPNIIHVIEKSYATRLEQEISKKDAMIRHYNTFIEQLQRAHKASDELKEEELTKTKELLAEAMWLLKEMHDKDFVLTSSIELFLSKLEGGK